MVRHATPPRRHSYNSNPLPMILDQNHPAPAPSLVCRVSSNWLRLTIHSGQNRRGKTAPCRPDIADFQHVMVQDPFGPCRHHCACVSGMFLRTFGLCADSSSASENQDNGRICQLAVDSMVPYRSAGNLISPCPIQTLGSTSPVRGPWLLVLYSTRMEAQEGKGIDRPVSTVGCCGHHGDLLATGLGWPLLLCKKCERHNGSEKQTVAHRSNHNVRSRTPVVVNLTGWLGWFSCRPSYRVMLPVAVHPPRRKVSDVLVGTCAQGGTNPREFSIIILRIPGGPIKDGWRRIVWNGFWWLEDWSIAFSSAATATNRIHSWHLGLPSKASPGEAAREVHVLPAFLHEFCPQTWHDLREKQAGSCINWDLWNGVLQRGLAFSILWQRYSVLLSFVLSLLEIIHSRIHQSPISCLLASKPPALDKPVTQCASLPGPQIVSHVWSDPDFLTQFPPFLLRLGLPALGNVWWFQVSVILTHWLFTSFRKSDEHQCSSIMSITMINIRLLLQHPHSSSFVGFFAEHVQSSLMVHQSSSSNITIKNSSD